MYRLHFTCYYNCEPCSINTTSYIACAIDVYHWLLLLCPYCHGTTSKHQWYYKISSFVNNSSLDMHTLFYIFLGSPKKGMIRVPNSLKSWMSFSCMIFHQTPALFCIMDHTWINDYIKTNSWYTLGVEHEQQIILCGALSAWCDLTS